MNDYNPFGQELNKSSNDVPSVVMILIQMISKTKEGSSDVLCERTEC